jgi:imidazolonepropionase-like amidohydrolase
MATKPILIHNALIWDGTGAAAFPGQVRVDGERIATVAPATESLAADGATKIDARGRFLMPGMIEGHSHITFMDLSIASDLGEIPPEEHTLGAMHNARKLLDAGFTSACSAASAKLRLDVVIRNEINAGRIPGPRMLAAGPEITVTGGLGDADLFHVSRNSFGMVADGPDDIVKAVRLCIREGVDIVKINISGDFSVPSSSDLMTVMNEAETRAAVEATHERGKRIASHSRAPLSVQRALQAGVDIIYHCDHADEKTLDMLEAAKDRVITGPAFGNIVNALAHWEKLNTPAAVERAGTLRRLFDNSCRTHAEMRRRGIRVVIGGDYGFATNPQGTNARDLEHFVTHYGFSPSEALQAATRIGGEIMDMGDELGLVKPGYLADLLLIDGNPLDDVRILQDQRKIRMIMQGGKRYKG